MEPTKFKYNELSRMDKCFTLRSTPEYERNGYVVLYMWQGWRGRVFCVG